MSTIEVRTEGRQAVVTGPPRLNMTAAPRMREALAQAVADGSPQIVVDLGGTTFVDSSGLGALVGGLKTARQAGGDLVRGGLAQATHALGNCTLTQGLYVGTGRDQRPEVIIEHHDFVDPGTPPVTTVSALRAANGLVGITHRTLAVRA